MGADLNLFLLDLTAGAVLYAPFAFLFWASGYLKLLTDAARARGWGFRPPPLRPIHISEDDLGPEWLSWLNGR